MAPGMMVIPSLSTSMMILLLLILMMGIPLDMIQIEVILQMAPLLLQRPLVAQQLTFAFIGYYSEQYP